ncbi:MAG TPA: hypothetical protein VGA79_07605 [Desulfobaccales bacterium]
MTRNLLTELVIRLLGIWFLITCLNPLLHSILTSKDVSFTFWIIFFIFTSISILAIVFSERISKLIWIDRKIDDEIIAHGEERNIFMPLISIIGLYFIISSLAMIIQELAYILVFLPGFSAGKEIYVYNIIKLIHLFLLLFFGIIVFAFPDKLINIRFNIRKIFKREKINWENVEEE